PGIQYGRRAVLPDQPAPSPLVRAVDVERLVEWAVAGGATTDEHRASEGESRSADAALLPAVGSQQPAAGQRGRALRPAHVAVAIRTPGAAARSARRALHVRGAHGRGLIH